MLFHPAIVVDQDHLDQLRERGLLALLALRKRLPESQSLQYRSTSAKEHTSDQYWSARRSVLVTGTEHYWSVA